MRPACYTTAGDGAFEHKISAKFKSSAYMCMLPSHVLTTA